MPLSVKVSFQTTSRQHGGRGTSTHEEESRRFGIEEDVASNYEYFRAKVVSIMPSLKNTAFRMFWKDDEDDLIAFSSDDELIEALSHVPDSTDCTFRVYIREVDDVTSTPPIGCCNGSRVSSGCGDWNRGINITPLHLLFGQHQHQGAFCGGRRPRATTCSRRHADDAATSSSTENQRTNAEPATAAGGAEKMDEAEAGCSKTDQHTGDDGEQRVTGDFLMDMFSGIGSLLTSLGVQNNQSRLPGENIRDGQSPGEKTNDVTGTGGADDGNSEGNASKEKSSESDQSPRVGMSDQSPRVGMTNDGLIQVVETLKEMGFKDEDGSLSRLVATHSGQIERIIQFIETCRATC